MKIIALTLGILLSLSGLAQKAPLNDGPSEIFFNYCESNTVKVNVPKKGLKDKVIQLETTFSKYTTKTNNFISQSNEYGSHPIDVVDFQNPFEIDGSSIQTIFPNLDPNIRDLIVNGNFFRAPIRDYHGLVVGINDMVARTAKSQNTYQKLMKLQRYVHSNKLEILKRMGKIKTVYTTASQLNELKNGLPELLGTKTKSLLVGFSVDRVKYLETYYRDRDIPISISVKKCRDQKVEELSFKLSDDDKRLFSLSTQIQDSQYKISILPAPPREIIAENIRIKGSLDSNGNISLRIGDLFHIESRKKWFSFQNKPVEPSPVNFSDIIEDLRNNQGSVHLLIQDRCGNNQRYGRKRHLRYPITETNPNTEINITIRNALRSCEKQQYMTVQIAFSGSQYFCEVSFSDAIQLTIEKSNY